MENNGQSEYAQMPKDPLDFLLSAKKNQIGQYKRVFIEETNPGYKREMWRVCSAYDRRLVVPERQQDLYILRHIDGSLNFVQIYDTVFVVTDAGGGNWRVAKADVQGSPLLIKKKLTLEITVEELEELKKEVAPLIKKENRGIIGPDEGE